MTTDATVSTQPESQPTTCRHFWRIQSGHGDPAAVRLQCKRDCGRLLTFSAGEWNLLVSKGELDSYLERLYGKAEG